MINMKHLSPFILTVCICASPAGAQDPQEPGLSLMERGARMFMEGIMQEMEPAIDELSELTEDMGPALRSFAEDMGPKLSDLLRQVDDWTAYQAPEILPNGDIIIRRKPDHPLEEPQEPTEPAPQIDL